MFFLSCYPFFFLLYYPIAWVLSSLWIGTPKLILQTSTKPVVKQSASRFKALRVWPISTWPWSMCFRAQFNVITLDPRSIIERNHNELFNEGLSLTSALGLYNRPGLKFYNLHQTLNTSINALNSFTDIYLISSARSGFVFFISFTSFFLTLICPHHILSGTSCQAWSLLLVHFMEWFRWGEMHKNLESIFKACTPSLPVYSPNCRPKSGS